MIAMKTRKNELNMIFEMEYIFKEVLVFQTEINKKSSFVIL